MGTGPFSDVLIIDLTHILAGPFCTMLLAEFGARVVKVERAHHGDETRRFGPLVNGKSAYFASVNRGKEGVALDFEDPADRELLLEMIRRADVFVENLRIGTTHHLGLEYEELRAINPRIIYAALSGYGYTGPWREKPAVDPIIQAGGGLMSITGHPGGPPTKVGSSVMDYFSGLFLLVGIEAALYHRARTGEGMKIDVGMFDCEIATLETALLKHLATGEIPQPLGNRHPAAAPIDTFATGDRPLFVAAGTDAHFAQLCMALGRPELAADPRFATNVSRTQNYDELKPRIEAILKAAPATEWVRKLEAIGVLCSLIQTVADAVANPQTSARNMIVEAGGIRMAGNPVKLSILADPPTRKPAPELDADGATIRAEFAPGRKA